MKIVVFDLDETLGYFTEFGIFWDSLAYYLKDMDRPDLTQSDFDNTLDLFPEVLRPNIINILSYLKERKEAKSCSKMMIYTNNNGPKEWANKIVKYFEKKIDCRLIDQIIAAFKVDGKNVQVGRTTHYKTHDDLIRCSRIPASAEICFVDDTFYPGMSNDKIYYINIKPYYYDLKFEEIIERFKTSGVGRKLINNDDEFGQKIIDHIQMYNYKCLEKDPQEYEVDKILGKQIIVHLNIFFNNPRRNKTIKNRRKHSAKNQKTKRNNTL